jgi:hypothetical protein
LPSNRYQSPSTLDLQYFLTGVFPSKKSDSPQVLGGEEVLFGLWYEQFQFTPILFGISKLSFNFVHFSVIINPAI